MAKSSSSKLEDYWRENHIEALLKELTQLLTRRMPSDPALAIVEHLQKKFPKSFKASAANIGLVPKNLASTLQLQTLALASPHSDRFDDSASDMPLGRRLSNQSTGSGIGTIPTKGSAFTSVPKHDTSNLSDSPATIVRNLTSAHRVGQQTIKLGKNIRSERDILEEELFRPIKHKAVAVDDEHLPFEPVADDSHEMLKHEELTVKQIIKYKHNIQTENNRREHREKLAKLAKQQREKEDFLRSDQAVDLEELQQQHADQDQTSEDNEKTASHKTAAKSKEEEDILNDENIFQPRVHRHRGRPRHKVMTARSATSDLPARFARDGRSMRNEIRNMYCKACGAALTAENTLLKPDSTQTHATTNGRPLEPPPTDQSVAASTGLIDDWFDSSASASTSRQSTPRTFDDAIPLPNGASTFRRNLFQTIKDSNHDGNININRLTSPRFSESGIFARSPDTRPRRPSSSRSLTSPTSKPTRTSAAQPTPPRSRRPSSSAAAMFDASD